MGQILAQSDDFWVGLGLVHVLAPYGAIQKFGDQLPSTQRHIRHSIFEN